MATPNTKKLAEDTVEDYVNSMFSFKEKNAPKVEEQKANDLDDKKFQDNGYDYKQFITQMIEDRKKQLMREAISRGIKPEHVDLYVDTETFVDFDIGNLITRMIKEGIISKENGYDDLNLIKHPNGIEAVKKRRTEAELDQMKDA